MKEAQQNPMPTTYHEPLFEEGVPEHVRLAEEAFEREMKRLGLKTPSHPDDAGMSSDGDEALLCA